MDGEDGPDDGNILLVNSISIPKLACIDIVPPPPKAVFPMGTGSSTGTGSTINDVDLKVAGMFDSEDSNSNRSVISGSSVASVATGTNSGNNSAREDTKNNTGTTTGTTTSGGLVASASQLLTLPGGNSAANMYMLNNMVSSNNAAIVDVKEDLPQDGSIPPRRDIHAWRNRLFPRVLEVYSPMFSLEYCR